MTYLSENMPAPEPTIDDQVFWQNAAQGRLVFQQCAESGRHRHPPGPMCPSSQSTQVNWVEAPKQGKIFSYTVSHVAPHPALKDKAPYIIALVEFPSLDGIRLVTNIINAEPEELAIGLDVELVFEPLGDDMQVPRFKLVK